MRVGIRIALFISSNSEIKMKIGLINTYSYNNVGDAAIYAALNKMLAGHEIYTTLLNNQGVAPDGMVYSENLNQCDGYVSVGGDIFNNARPQFVTRNFLKNLNQLKQAPKTTFLFGQSIPASCRGLGLKLLTQKLKRISSVTIRDKQTYDLLQKHGVNCKLSFDTAFVLDCSEAAVNFAREILAEMNAPQSAVISLREFNSLYPVDNGDFVNNIATLSQKLIAKDYQPILLIQSSVSEMDSDWVIAKAIQARCPNVKVLDLVSYNSAFPSWELLQAILKVAHLIVAVRYHTAVLALASGRIPYNLYYSNKGADLCHRLNIPGGHISKFNPESKFDLIEQTRLMPFEIESVRKRVASDFTQALKACVDQHQAVSALHKAA
jgi:polysaccharide pyruvyl transferase WcaK-like protein